MRILDESGREVAEYDPDSGKLIPETVVVAHHDAAEEVPEECELVTLWQGDDPNDRLVKRVVTREHIPARDAWDETEDILRLVPYTDEELAAREAERREMEQVAREAAASAALSAALPDAIDDLAAMVSEVMQMVEATMDAMDELAAMVASGEGD